MAKTEVVRARFSEADLAVLDAAAERAGLDRSKLIRRAVRSYTGEAYFTDEDTALLRGTTAELNALGRNLMMAVRQMNRMLKAGDPRADTRDHYSRDEFERLHGTVTGLVKTLRGAVHRRSTLEKKP